MLFLLELFGFGSHGKNNMKNIRLILRYVILLCLLFGTTLTYSQKNDSIKRLSIGFEAGVQFTKIYDSWAISSLPKAKTGFITGVFVDYQLKNNFTTRIGLYYDNRGFLSQDVLSPISEIQGDSIYSSYSSYYSTDLDFTLNYLTIPLSFIYTQGSDKWSFFLQGTIYYSLLISANRTGNTILYIYPEHAVNFEDPELRVPGYTITEYNKEDVYDSFSGNDWGIQVGFGVSYTISPKIDITVSPAFTLAFASLYANPSRDSKWNSIYKINAGIIYRL